MCDAVGAKLREPAVGADTIRPTDDDAAHAVRGDDIGASDEAEATGGAVGASSASPL